MEPTVPTETHVIVSFDEDQTAECIIDAVGGTHRVTFGPTLPAGHEHGETMLMHVLRSLVAPVVDVAEHDRRESR